MLGYDEQVAAVYDEVQQDRFAEAETTVDLLAELAGAGPVLELGVGTGRLALPLARRGLTVHGIDASAPMVDRLRAKPGGDSIGVVMGDIADIGSLISGPYTLVVVAFNTLFELATQEEQARCLNAPYLTLLGKGRPHIHLKWAMTLDGKIATRTGDSKWISGEESRGRVHQLRRRPQGVAALPRVPRL